MIQEKLKNYSGKIEKLKSEVSKIIVGNEEVIENVIIAILAGGNVLFEGVPGIGKTVLVKTLAKCLNLKFSRIQFTPDLMPADITGTNLIIETEEGKKFQFQKGAIFGNIILADEINRATPKTQSALLEAMQEHSVTVIGQKYDLEQPFFVLATQNPIEMEGTYPLPEAQLDRFLFKILVGKPSINELEEIMDRTTKNDVIEVQQILDASEILEIREFSRGVKVASNVKNYIARLTYATYPDSKETTDFVKKYVRYGSSPRGAQALMISAKIKAIMSGRYNLSFEDVKSVALPILRHRLILSFQAEAEGIESDVIVNDMIKNIPNLSEDLALLDK